jgi:periplasmic divalent cation tolerance protein
LAVRARVGRPNGIHIQQIPLRSVRSVHNFTPVLSIYGWHGKVHERTEGRASLHTSRGRVAEIVERAKQEHPYEVPGVSTRPITDGNPDYLAWIAQETETRPRA